MRKTNRKTILAFGLSLAMVLTGFGSSAINRAMSNAEAADDDDVKFKDILTPDDIKKDGYTVTWNTDKQSNVGAEHKSESGITTKDNGTMRDGVTATYLAQKEMGVGANIGNTMEAVQRIARELDANGDEKPTKYDIIKGTDATAYDQAWGQPAVTKEYVDAMYSYGINTVRIPVAWSNGDNDDGTFTIDKKLLDRVEEVANYALSNGMYVVINDHWDNQWWGGFGAVKKDAKGNALNADGEIVKNVNDAAPDEEMRAKTWTRYERYWTQIANRFKGYSDHLILEGANEELGSRLNDEIYLNGYSSTNANDDIKVVADQEKKVGGNLTTKELYETTNAINQKFVDIVRGTGGNNASRFLLIPGYNTDISRTVDGESLTVNGVKENYTFEMPKDTDANGKDKLFLSVHYYCPTDFALDKATGDYSLADQKYTQQFFGKLSKFTNQGYATIIGECGFCNPGGVDGSVTQWFLDTYKAAQANNAVPVLWDTGEFFNRKTAKLIYKDIADFYNTINGTNGDASMTKLTGGTIDPNATPEPIPVPNYIDKTVWNTKGPHAYLFYQMADTWDYRNAFNPFRSMKDGKDSYIYIQSGGSQVADTTVVKDVALDHNGEYTVSIDGVNLTTAKKYNMLGVATDLLYKTYKTQDIKVTNATVKVDGVALSDKPVDLTNKTDKKYYNFMAVNTYDEAVIAPFNDLNTNQELAIPTGTLEITFTVSGLDQVLSDVADGSYIDPQTGQRLDYVEPTATPDATVTPSANPTVTETPVPAPVPTETPVTEIGAKKGASFTVGNYKYKVTKAATTAAKGTVSLTGLTSKGKKASKLTVATTVKSGSASYTVSALGSKVFKSAKAKSVTLNKYIKTIPASAFASCTKLSTVTTKAKLTKVTKNAFKGCKKTIKVKGTSAKANVKLLKKSGYKKFK